MQQELNMSIKLTDTIETTQANSGGAKVTRTLTELNDLISTEESGRLDDLEASVDTAGTGLLDRTTALETSVDTATTGLLDRMTAAEGDIDDLEAIAPAAFATAPVFSQSAGTCTTGTGITEILWTSAVLGTAGDGATIAIVYDAEATGAEVTVDGTDITVAVEASGDPLATAVTCTDVINAVAGEPAAAAIMTGLLVGGGGAVPEDIGTITGGMDITIGEAGALRHFGGVLYFTPTESTVSTSNWRRVVLDWPTTIIVNDASASAALVLAAASQTVVVLDNNEKNIELPEATGSGIEIRIQNRNSADHDVVVSDSSGDVIDADGTITLAQYASCVLVDVAAGVWAQL